MTDASTSCVLNTLVGSYRPEVMEENEIPSYLASISRQDLISLRKELSDLISNDVIGLDFAYRRTGLDFPDKKAAVAFFQALFDYLEGKAELPDIYDYAE
ncbi:hypothetical protein [Thalassospira sp. TSL5-1]|uniref:hypothetical protein n=1 Tax=Thalassospira sp. TSL5-1 TaxID=1544451 RepID=UPI0009670E67|nr:hypothetical protein [Thalassospira sp. TSL5-1]OKH87064.1 hypothetical protein LF95_18900 [Thalassospira sp. TSL5-1]